MPQRTVGMCPYPNDSEWNTLGNPLLGRLVKAIEQVGWKVEPVDAYLLERPDEIRRRGIDVLHLHWADAAYNLVRFERWWPGWVRLPPSLRGIHKRLSRAAGAVRLHLRGRRIVSQAYADIDAWITALCEARIPIVWQVHDLLAHAYLGAGTRALGAIDRRLNERIFGAARSLVLHERCCVPEVLDFFGGPKDHVVVPLGPLAVRPPIDRATARSRLSLQRQGRVLSYLGTARPNRNPRHAIQAFCDVAGPRHSLVVAGQGVGGFVPRAARGRGSIHVLDGFVAADAMRDIYCASDFVINDAEGYLTSGVIRTAMEYGRPVIAHPQGCAVDMAAGAAVWIQKPMGLKGAVGDALEMSELRYTAMVESAGKLNAERQWPAAAAVLTDLYARLTA